MAQPIEEWLHHGANGVGLGAGRNGAHFGDAHGRDSLDDNFVAWHKTLPFDGGDPRLDPKQPHAIGLDLGLQLSTEELPHSLQLVRGRAILKDGLDLFAGKIPDP